MLCVHGSNKEAQRQKKSSALLDVAVRTPACFEGYNKMLAYSLPPQVCSGITSEINKWNLLCALWL